MFAVESKSLMVPWAPLFKSKQEAWGASLWHCHWAITWTAHIPYRRPGVQDLGSLQIQRRAQACSGSQLTRVQAGRWHSHGSPELPAPHPALGGWMSRWEVSPVCNSDKEITSNTPGTLLCWLDFFFLLLFYVVSSFSPNSLCVFFLFLVFDSEVTDSSFGILKHLCTIFMHECVCLTHF